MKYPSLERTFNKTTPHYDEIRYRHILVNRICDYLDETLDFSVVPEITQYINVTFDESQHSNLKPYSGDTIRYLQAKSMNLREEIVTLALSLKDDDTIPSEIFHNLPKKLKTFLHTAYSYSDKHPPLIEYDLQQVQYISTCVSLFPAINTTNCITLNRRLIGYIKSLPGLINPIDSHIQTYLGT